MSQHTRAHTNAHYYRARAQNDNEDSDDLGQIEDNSFQTGNEIFELKSKINELKIQQSKLSIEHKKALQTQQAKSQVLNQQLNNLKKQNTKLTTSLKKLQGQNEQLKRILDTYKNQIEGNNRKTADFHRSMEDNSLDPRDFINQVLAKEKIITQLKSRLQQLQSRPGSSIAQKGLEVDRQKYQQEIKNLKNTVDQLKKKQIAYKRQYESMIQSKEDIIKKMSNQNEECSRKIFESKDTLINELRKQIENQQNKIEGLKNDLNILGQRNTSYEREINRIKSEGKRKQQSLLNHFEAERQQLIRNLNQKLKKNLKDKDERLGKSQQRTAQLQSHILSFKQEVGKQKAEIQSLNQYNQYLEKSNKDYEESKKKLQSNLCEKQKQIGQIRQSYYTEIGQLKKLLIQQKNQFQHKISLLSQQVLEKNIAIQKYQLQIQQINKKDVQVEDIKQSTKHFQKQIERLNGEIDERNAEYEALRERYKEKSDKLLNLEKKIRKQYEDRIAGLQGELIKQRQSIRSKQTEQRPSIKSPQFSETGNEKMQQQLQRFKNVSEIRKLEIEEKQQQIKRLSDQKAKIQKQVDRLKDQNRQTEKKLKDKIEDYKNLEISFDDLSEKYRKGVKELQIKIEQMQQQIYQEKRKAQKKKNQVIEANQNEKQLAQQVKQWKSKAKQYEQDIERLSEKVKQLEQEVSQYKNRKVDVASETDLKLQKLAHEISIIKREKQSAIKSQQKKIRQREDVLLQQKAKLIEYIEQLEQNNSILSKKLEMLEGKDKKNYAFFEKELRQMKLQYSQTLKQLNIVLQKYKKLEEVHRQTLGGIDGLRQEKQILNEKYVQIYKQKNKIMDELNSAYDQINKLNIVLMSKQQQLSKSKVVTCPHYQNTGRSYYPINAQMQTPAFNYANQTQSKSPRIYERSQSFYSSNNQSHVNQRYKRL